MPAEGDCRIGLWLPHPGGSDGDGPLVGRIEVKIDAIGDPKTAQSRFAGLAAPTPWRQNLGADSCAQDGTALYCLRRDFLFHIAADTVRPVNFHNRTPSANGSFLDDAVTPVFARVVLSETS